MWCLTPRAIISEGQVDDLADLPARGVIVWLERPVTVPRDNIVAHRGLYEGVEGMAGGYVRECRRIGVEYVPCRCYHGYLGELSSGHVGKWSEGAVRVATYYVVVCCRLYK